MYICKGKVVGMNHYIKDGRDNYFAQVLYSSKISSFSGMRAVSVRVHGMLKDGSEISVLDDLMRPQVVEI